MSELLKLVSSQYKHLPHRGDGDICGRLIDSGSCLSGEPYSLQALYRAPKGSVCLPVSVRVESELPVETYRVDYVAVSCVINPNCERGFESNAPGLYPDCLMPRPSAPEAEKLTHPTGKPIYFEKATEYQLNATEGQYGAVWITVNPDSLSLRAGSYPVRVSLYSLADNSLLSKETLTLRVIDATAEELDIYYTNWFYVDCLCDAFGVSPYTEEFYLIFDEHIRNMTRHGQNTLLLPAFTPPLDVAIGDRRMNVQLVGVSCEDGKYSFDFTKMREFIRHATDCGIKYFEHSHLYSQWGALHAPSIYDTDGELLFGDDTEAAGAEYSGFIRAYLEAFMEFARAEEIEKRLIFHLSDEPESHHLENYRAVRRVVEDLLCGSPVCDAMSDPAFYLEGLVEEPVCRALSIESFGELCSTKWLYYTGGYREHCCSDRQIPNTAALTRVLGVQLYRYEAKGFLQWGYNYYYGRLSRGFGDPLSAPNTYKLYSGPNYLCYPIRSRKGLHVATSIREKLMQEAMNDLMALKLLEKKIGRAEVMSLCESYLGEVTYKTIPEGETLRELREAVNSALAEVAEHSK